MSVQVFTSDRASLPAGTDSVALQAGELVFLAAQTPRDRANMRQRDKLFAWQARMTRDNLEAAANAAGLSLKNAVKVSVFLRHPADGKECDGIYAEYVGNPPPARMLTQSDLAGIDREVDAIRYRLAA